jgi:hypothetical protein
VPFVRSGARRLLLLAVAASLLGAGCTVPGTDQAGYAMRCLAAPQAPRPSGAPLPAVWRTYRDPAGGITLSLPANWDAVAPDAADLPGQLAGAGRRSPLLRPVLARWAAQGPDTLGARPAVVAFSTDTAGLTVRETARVDHTAMCAAATAATAVPGVSKGEPLLLTRTSLPAGDAIQLSYGVSRTSRSVRLDYSLLQLFVTTPDRTLQLLFQAPRPRAAALRPVFRRIAESVRLGRQAGSGAAAGRNPASSCLYPDGRAPAFAAPRPPPCPMSVGALLAGRDCSAAQPDGDRVLSAGTFDAATGKLTGSASLSAGPSGCVLDVAAGTGISFGEPGLEPADVVAVMEFELPPGTVAGIVVRQGPSSAVRTVVSTEVPHLFVWDQAEGQPAHQLLSGYRRTTPDVRHRLVVSVRGGQVLVWLDGVQSGPVATAVTRPGSVVGYLLNPSGAPVTFRSVHIALFEPDS